MKKERALIILNEIVQEELNLPITKKKFERDRGSMYITGVRLSKEEADLFKEEAKVLKNLELWKFLMTQLGSEARYRIINDGLTREDYIAPRAVLYTIKSFKDIIAFLHSAK